MFWGDEIFGRLVLTQPSLSASLHVWREGLDSSGIWFYLFGRIWIAIFGASEISLRMYSAVPTAATAAVVWILARRYYSLLPVAASVSFIFASWATLRWQLSNGRTYGLFVFASSLVLYLIFRGEKDETNKTHPLFLLATFAAYSLLAGSQMLGIVYVSAFLAIQMVLDARSHRRRPWLYLSAAAAVWVTLCSSANIKATMAIGKPSFWTLRPSLHDLFFLNTVFDSKAKIFISAAALLALILFRIRRQRVPVYIVLAGFAVLNVLFFAVSRITTSIYVDRYLLPFSIAAILLLCELLTQLQESDAPKPRLRACIAPLFLLLAVAFFFLPRLNNRIWFPFPNYTDGFLNAMPRDLPIVDTDAGNFTEVEYYHHGTMIQKLFFPVDWEVALDPSNPGGVSGFHEMDNFKKLGIYSNDILSTQKILAENRDFIVLTGTPPTAWLERRILSNPKFSIVKLGTYRCALSDIDVWVVHSL
jgi:hypothetical protein